MSDDAMNGPEMGPMMGPEMGPTMSPEMGPMMGPEMGLIMGPELGPMMGPEMGPTMGLEMGPSIDPDMGPTMDSEMDPTMDTMMPRGVPFPITGIMPGMHAPDFVANCYHNGEIENFRLSSLREKDNFDEEAHRKWAIILFYPVDFDYIAPTELLKLQEFVKDLDEINCVPVAISPTGLFAKQMWATTPPCNRGVEGVTFRLVEDNGRAIAKRYEIGSNDRSITILDSEGIVQVRIVCDAPIGLRIKDAIRLVKACQTSKHQNVATGAGWEEGMAIQERYGITIAEVSFRKSINIARYWKDENAP